MICSHYVSKKYIGYGSAVLERASFPGRVYQQNKVKEEVHNQAYQVYVVSHINAVSVSVADTHVIN